jgi:hypothetical protein
MDLLPVVTPIPAADESEREALEKFYGETLTAWLGSRNGRKVRVKIGGIEAEAQTRAEVEKLIVHALEIQQELQQRDRPPKVIP